MKNDIRRLIVRDIKRKKKDRNQAVSHLKYHIPLNDIKYCLGKLSNFEKQYCFSNPIPQTYSKLGWHKIPINGDATIEKELQWQFIKFSNFQSTIEIFLELQRQFEKSYNDSSFLACFEILDQIEEKIGVSLWLISKKLILCDESNDKNKKDYLKEIDQDDVYLNIKVLASYLDYKYEIDSPISAYNTFLNSLNYKYADSPDFLSFLNIYLLPTVHKTDKVMVTKILQFFGENSVIDIYLLVKKLLPVLIENEIKIDNVLHDILSHFSNFPEEEEWLNICKISNEYNSDSAVFLKKNRNNIFKIPKVNGALIYSKFNEYLESIFSYSTQNLNDKIDRVILNCDDSKVGREFYDFFNVNRSIDCISNTEIIQMYLNNKDIEDNNGVNNINRINTLLYTQRNKEAHDLINKSNLQNLSWALFNTKTIQCLLAMNKEEQAIEIIVKESISRNELMPCLYSKILQDKIVSDCNLNSIYEPCLLFLYDSKDEIIYDAYADFLLSREITRPSMLIATNNDIDKNILVYFFRYICTIEILSESFFFENLEDVENERLTLLHYLKENSDKEACQEFNKEIFKINTKSVIRDAVVKFHDSRIYIETKKLKQFLKQNLFDDFNRYINFDDIDFYDYSNMNLNEEKHNISFKPYYLSNEDTAVFISNSRYITFINMFNFIVNEYVFHKDFGLKSFLSMRIRHGTFKNQLRSVFENQKLFDFDNYQNQALNNEMSFFSKEIDRINSSALERINIYEKKSDKGLFNYKFTDQELFFAFIYDIGKESSLESFCKVCISVLDARTEANNNKIKQYLEMDLLPEYCELIDTYITKLSSIKMKNVENIKRNLITSKTEIQHTLNSVQKWFKISRNDLVESYDLSTIIHATIKFQNSINSINFKVNTEIDGKLIVKGEFFYPMADLFNIIFDNVIKYSNKYECKLYCKKTESTISIIVTNNIEDFEDFDFEVIKNINNIKSGTENSFEGKSGYPKIHKLISEDLKQNNYDIEVSCIEEKFNVRIDFYDEGVFEYE